jgi:hypothetical protein
MLKDGLAEELETVPVLPVIQARKEENIRRQEKLRTNRALEKR